MAPAVEAPDRPLSQVEQGRIALLSPKTGLRVTLVPPRLEPTLGGALREAPESRKQIVFRDGRAWMKAEWLPLLKEHPAFTGIGQQKIVFLENDPDAPAVTGQGVQVVTGAISSVNGPTQTPMPGWDDMTVAAIKQALGLGLISDPIAAITHESTHRRRQSVLLALMDAGREKLAESDVEGLAPDDEAGPEPRALIPRDQKVD